MNPTTAVADKLLAQLLAGLGPAWPDDWGDEKIVLFWTRVEFHGVGSLVSDLIPSDRNWPEQLVRQLKAERRRRAQWEIRHRLILDALLDDLEFAGLPIVILKGTAFAYDLYSSPSARHRGDTDLLIDPLHLEEARESLERAGLRRALPAGAINQAQDLQEIWSFQASDGTTHEIDLHWSAINSHALSSLLPTEECFANTRSLPRLHPHAKGLAIPYALVHASLHRGMHVVSPYFVGSSRFTEANRLIWLSDIERLCHRMRPDDWKTLIGLCHSRGVAAICADGLEATSRVFNAPLPGQVLDALRQEKSGKASSYLMEAGRHRRFLSDIASLPDIGSKLKFALHRAFPQEEFLRSRYPLLKDWPVPIVHLRRISAWLLQRNNGPKSS